MEYGVAGASSTLLAERRGRTTNRRQEPTRSAPPMEPMREPTPWSVERIADYYGAAQGKQGVALLTALHSIVKQGHRDIGYAQARDGLFGLVDRAPDGGVFDLYTGDKSYNVTDRHTAMAAGLNAEHTWPQSKGARDIGQSDLHQLMSADIQTNGRRGNMAYGLVQHEEWHVQSKDGSQVSRIGLDASGERVFEPRAAIRGDIARALLYFFVRYDSDRQRDYTLENFRHELPALVQWSKEDPVDAFEHRRNDAVFSLQGNRNPFIDHPEWVDSIFGGGLPGGARDALRGTAQLSTSR